MIADFAIGDLLLAYHIPQQKNKKFSVVMPGKSHI